MVACDHFHYLHNSLRFIKLKVCATNHLIPVTVPCPSNPILYSTILASLSISCKHCHVDCLYIVLRS